MDLAAADDYHYLANMYSQKSLYSEAQLVTVCDDISSV